MKVNIDILTFCDWKIEFHSYLMLNKNYNICFSDQKIFYRFILIGLSGNSFF